MRVSSADAKPKAQRSESKPVERPDPGESTDGPRATGQGETPVSKARPTAETAEAARARSGLEDARFRAHLLGEDSVARESMRLKSRVRRPFMLEEEALAPVAASAAASGPTEGFVANADGSHRFVGTAGDDNYSVTQSGGDLTVTNDDTGATYTLAAADVRNGVRFTLHGGDDRLNIDGSVRADLDVHGGAGDDYINARDARGDLGIHGGLGNDTIVTGRGDDDVDGDGGNDVILAGDGDDIIHGGSGDDRLYGQGGDDRLIGEGGDDKLYGGDDMDFAIGGEGTDLVDGGDGSDALYGDAHDTVDAGATSWRDPDDGVVDQVVVAEGATVRGLDANDTELTYSPEDVDQWLTDHPEVRISGSAEFRERVVADLGVMLAGTQGNGLLTDLTDALQDQGQTLTISETDGSAVYRPGTNEATSSSAVWDYRDGTFRTPTTALFHELVHGYQDLVGPDPAGSTEFANGRVIENDERQTTGLPWLDSAGNPGDALPYSENLFRVEIGLPERTAYGSESGAAVRYVP